MKQFSFFFFLLVLAVAARSQRNYTEAIQQGDAAFNKGQYKIAINKYFAAEAFDPSKKQTVKEKVNKVFEKIEQLRIEAEAAKRQALIEKNNAENNSLLAINQKNRAEAAQAAIEKSRIEADTAKDQAIRSAAEANSALAKANKLINSFYFYQDRFALAFKDYFYFINKNGDSLGSLGEWEKAEQFDATGFAKVRRRDYYTGTSPIDYLVDTLGQYYPVAFDIKDISITNARNQVKDGRPTVEALYLTVRRGFNSSRQILSYKPLRVLILDSERDRNELPSYTINLNTLTEKISQLQKLENLQLIACNLKSFPLQICELKRLMFLNLSENQLTSLPGHISKLSNLISLDLSKNQLSGLPEEIEGLFILQFLDLRGNLIPTDEVEKIKKRLPHCTILF